MDDFASYELKDLFRVRDALEIFNEFGLADEEVIREVGAELNLRMTAGAIL